MANLIRWDPVGEMMGMRNAMDRAFDEFFSRTPMQFEGYGVFDLDLIQTDENLIVKASLPGVKPDDIDISITGDTLTIKGNINEDNEFEKESYHIKERKSGTFSRSILLPVIVQSEKAKAEFENGELYLTLPKAEEMKPKTITVKAK